MKRKLGKTRVNPLDLLLDTTSNVFGSMILIAIMIALFAGNPSSSHGLMPGDITSEAIARQIQNAEKNATVLATELSKVKATNGEKTGARDLADLQSEIDSLNAQIERAKKSQRDGVMESIVDYGATAAGATRDESALQQESARMQNAITTDEQQISQLKDQLKELEAKVKKEREKKVQRLSLPKERETDQTALWVIIINNEVFPERIFDASGGSSDFVSGITVSKQSDEEDLWTANRGRGYSFPNRKEDIVEQIRRMPRDQYVACLVFPDSVDTFRDFEQIVHGLGRDIGWEPVDMEKQLIFSSHGTRPKPQ